MKRPTLRRPPPAFIIVSLTIGIIIGVILSFLTNLWFFASPIWIIISAALIIINFLKPYTILLFLPLIAGLILGAFRTNLDLTDRTYITQFIGQTIEVTGTLYEDPALQESEISLRLTHLRFADHPETSGSLYVQLSNQDAHSLERSDQITIKGTLSTGFGSFAASLYRPTIIHIAHPDPPDLALKIRNNFANQIKSFIPAPEVNLALGYLLGQRRAIPTDLNETLRIVGLIHIVVASGFHLGIIIAASRRIFAKLSRFAALFFSLLLILAFLSITGFTPSMARAALVATLSILAWFVGRQFHPAKLLLLVAALTLLINPAYIQDLGYLLSFAAFSGVMLLAPLVTAYFYGKKKPNFLSELIIATTSAQLLCTPILLYAMGSISVLSILANALILPTIPAVMLLTFATGLTAALPLIPLFLGKLTALVLSYHLAIVDFLSAQTWALITLPTNTLPTLLLFIPLIFLATYFKKSTNYNFITSAPDHHPLI
jgi:competence protein ComEC